MAGKKRGSGDDRVIEAEAGPSTGAAAAPCDESCWFRSSDDVRQGFVRGIDRFDVKPVTYNVIENVAIFEGDIALGTPEEMDAMVAAVVAETADDVRELAMAASPGAVVHGVGIPGLRFRWPNGVVPYTVVQPLRNAVNQAIEHFRTHTRIRFVERTAANAAQYPNWVGSAFLPTRTSFASGWNGHGRSWRAAQKSPTWRSSSASRTRAISAASSSEWRESGSTRSRRTRRHAWTS
jgi:hypothetical protein